jgi:ADP-ribose pyrophosphatase YjhB (NUDIX family)
MKTQFTIGAFAIIENDCQDILLCYREDLQLWNLPGGGLNNGEAPWEGVIREVAEETGLNVSVERLIGIYSKPETNDLVFLFKCQRESGALTITEEAQALRYFKSTEIPSNTIAKQVERIHDYLAGETQIVLKKQPNQSA